MIHPLLNLHNLRPKECHGGTSRSLFFRLLCRQILPDVDLHRPKKGQRKIDFTKEPTATTTTTTTTATATVTTTTTTTTTTATATATTTTTTATTTTTTTTTRRRRRRSVLKFMSLHVGLLLLWEFLAGGTFPTTKKERPEFFRHIEGKLTSGGWLVRRERNFRCAYRNKSFPTFVEIIQLAGAGIGLKLSQRPVHFGL